MNTVTNHAHLNTTNLSQLAVQVCLHKYESTSDIINEVRRILNTIYFFNFIWREVCAH